MKLNVAVAFLASSLVKSAMADVARVDIKVTCEGVDLESLSKAEAVFSAKSLEKAYNQVHEIADHGNWKLYNLVKNGKAADGELGDSSGYAGGGSCGPFCGGDGPIDDELCTWYYPPSMCEDLAAIDTTTLWEKVFMDKLKAGPHKKFADVKDCDIIDSWTWSTETVAETTRALRG
eukprot:scaffold25307_cov168-Amphora_coffeaeformis.AAC.3